jgi:5'-deoxynucleotidase YfbR-like HD superfamily hydrolase
MMESKLLDLFHNVGELKKVKRSGWLRHDIPEPESVADHSFRCAFMALVLGDILELDTSKLVKMALIHDLAEITAGDITPYDDISKEEKLRIEEDAVRELFSGLPNKNQFIELWMEYARQESKEARFVRNIDKLEMAFQSKEYQNAHPQKDLSEFIREAEAAIDIHEICELLSILKSQA